VGLVGSQKSLMCASMFQNLIKDSPDLKSMLVITANPYQATQLYQDLQEFVDRSRLHYFPAPEIMPHEEMFQSPDLLMQRLQVLHKVVNLKRRLLVVAPVTAIMQRLIPREVFARSSIRLSVGDRLDRDELIQRFVGYGYERTNMVEGPGHFSVRGGIIDIFSFVDENPVRVEFFDDEVDSIRIFDLETQRSMENARAVWVPPAREILYDRGRLDAAVDAVVRMTDEQAQRLESIGRTGAAGSLRDRIAAHLEKLESGDFFDGMMQYLPIMHGSLESLVEYMSDGLILIDEPVRVRDQAMNFTTEFTENHALLLEKGRALPSEADVYLDWPGVMNALTGQQVVYFSGLTKRIQGMDPEQVINTSARPPDMFHGKVEMLTGKVKAWRDRRYRLLFLLANAGRCERLSQVLRDDGIPAVFVPEVDGHLKDGNVVFTTGNLSSGFEIPEERFLVLTDAEVFGQERQKRRLPVPGEEEQMSGNRINDYADLTVGNYVVHVNHGIGQYLGVKTLEIGGVHKDYLVVKYSGEDRLYVPVDQVELLQRYIGVEDRPPRLNRLGGNEWNRAKKRVKNSVRELAEGLLELYAKREAIEGYRFSPDTVWQEEFEDSFAYEETVDQDRAVAEVKKDMESPRPMDRLLCGDVGFGKTEVAIRATFKAVMDSKQVAVLVPTTILAQQHERTFSERFASYPIKVAVLSRFESAARQRKTLENLRSGAIDVVIGTHRLLSKDIRFKDLGLIIVDEEQRFGVAQKERLKRLRETVDVLTMTATPIPRTLHMSLVGVRDMSVIETPPKDRYPIRTYVVEYDDDVVRQAIIRELARDGQVYFVYNRVQGIDRIAGRLRSLVPEARIGVAHGQMDESKLENVMLQFLQGELDVLLCTTIIETGMDISNVNTLIVYDADRMGLAQLYQLRGRVGRSNRVAYSYFCYRKDKVLTEEAEKRLQAIKEFTELGSGFKIAMRDLEIRGAGNILGPEQHGFIASVGFQLYCKLLDESIKELKGEVYQQPPEPAIDIEVDAYLADSYVQDSKQKVEIYKKVAGVRELSDVDDLLSEIIDRFGDPPASVSNLLNVARVKIMARELGVRAIETQKNDVIIKFLEGIVISRDLLLAITRAHRGKVAATAGRSTQLRIKSRNMSDGELLTIILDILERVKNAWPVASGQ